MLSLSICLNLYLSTYIFQLREEGPLKDGELIDDDTAAHKAIAYNTIAYNRIDMRYGHFNKKGDKKELDGFCTAYVGFTTAG